MAATPHPAAVQHLPYFITAPGETDQMMVITTVMIGVIVLIIGSLFFRLHTLPERMTHKSQKMQFEIVAVLGLLALFTHIHLFWVAGLLLAFIDIPDFSSPLKSMAGSLQKMSGSEPEPEPVKTPDAGDAHGHGSAVPKQGA